MDQPISTPSDVKKDEAGRYPQQVAGYPTGIGPTQSHSQQLGYPAQVAYTNPQQGYILQPAAYSQVSKINKYPARQYYCIVER